jgi:putative ABC transport system permease protein
VKALKILINNGILKSKLQSIFIILGTGLCSMFIFASIIFYLNINKSFDTSYDKLSAAHTICTIPEDAMTQSDLERFLDELDYIYRYEVSKSYYAENIDLNKTDIRFPYISILNEHNTFDFAPLSKQRIPTLKENEIIIDNKTAQKIGSDIGDKVAIEVDGNVFELKIVGIVIDPSYGSSSINMVHCWINEKQQQKMYGEQVFGYYDTQIRFNNYSVNESEATLINDYEVHFNMKYDGGLSTYNDIRKTYTLQYQLFGKIFLFLSTFSFLMIIIINAFACKSAIYSDMRNIGILKVQGFNNNHILFIYLIRHLFLSTLSSLIGLILGGYLLKVWLGKMFIFIGTELFQINNIIFYQTSVFLLQNTIYFLSIYIVVKRVIKIKPINAAKELNHSKTNARKVNNKFFTNKHLSARLKLSILKMLQNKTEGIFKIVIAIGLSVLVLSSVYILNGIIHMDDNLMEWGIVKADAFISRNAGLDEKESGIIDYLNTSDEVEYYYAALTDKICYKDPKTENYQTINADVYQSPIPKNLQFKFVKGRNPENYNEIAVGLTFALNMGLNLGDSITLMMNLQEKEFIVVGIYPSITNFGQSVRFLTDDIIEYFGDSALGYYSIVLLKDINPYSFCEQMNHKFEGYEFIPIHTNNARLLTMIMPTIIVLVILFSAILFVVVFYLNVLAIKKQEYGIGVLKTIGFSIRDITLINIWQNGFYALIGVLLSIPLTINVIPIILKPLANSLGLSIVPILPNTLITIIVVLLVFGFFILSVKASVKLISKSSVKQLVN